MRSTGLWLERYNLFQSETSHERESEGCRYTGYSRKRKEGNGRLLEVLDAAYGLFHQSIASLGSSPQSLISILYCNTIYRLR